MLVKVKVPSTNFWKPKTNPIQLMSLPALWSEVCWNPKERRGEHYRNSAVHQQTLMWPRSAFMTLWRRHLDDVINKWSKELIFIAQIQFLGLMYLWLVVKWGVAEEQLYTIETTHFYTNTAIKCSLILINNKYGISSVKQCLSKRYFEYQFSRKRNCKINTNLWSHHSHLIYSKFLFISWLVCSFAQIKSPPCTKLHNIVSPVL